MLVEFYNHLNEIKLGLFLKFFKTYLHIILSSLVGYCRPIVDIQATVQIFYRQTIYATCVVLCFMHAVYYFVRTTATTNCVKFLVWCRTLCF